MKNKKKTHEWEFCCARLRRGLTFPKKKKKNCINKKKDDKAEKFFFLKKSSNIYSKVD